MGVEENADFSFELIILNTISAKDTIFDNTNKLYCQFSNFVTWVTLMNSDECGFFYL